MGFELGLVMHKGSCWELIEASLIRHAKNHVEQSKYPLFGYFVGHLGFFHKEDDETIAKAKYMLREWRFEDNIKEMTDKVKAIP
jgi:hypothetical protein